MIFLVNFARKEIIMRKSDVDSRFLVSETPLSEITPSMKRLPVNAILTPDSHKKLKLLKEYLGADAASVTPQLGMSTPLFQNFSIEFLELEARGKAVAKLDGLLKEAGEKKRPAAAQRTYGIPELDVIIDQLEERANARNAGGRRK